jgi:hypothetical protein
MEVVMMVHNERTVLMRDEEERQQQGWGRGDLPLVLVQGTMLLLHQHTEDWTSSPSLFYSLGSGRVTNPGQLL